MTVKPLDKRFLHSAAYKELAREAAKRDGNGPQLKEWNRKFFTNTTFPLVSSGVVRLSLLCKYSTIWLTVPARIESC
jgi:hypothetical protein